jgi:hypothetical protein
MKRLLVFLVTILSISVLTIAAGVQGKVMHNGAAATKALIIFSSNNVERARAITGDDGLYYVPNLPDGTYSVKVIYRDLTRDYSAIDIRGGKYDCEI